MEELDFDLPATEVSVKYGGQQYVLVEANESARIAYVSATIKAYKNKGEGMNETFSLLVSLCLFRIGGDGKRHPVSLKEIREMPARHVKRLHEKAMDISGLSEKSDTPELIREKIATLERTLGLVEKNGHTQLEEEAKNSRGATADTSV